MHDHCPSCRWLGWETAVWTATLLVVIVLGAFTLVAATGSPAGERAPARHTVVAGR